MAGKNKIYNDGDVLFEAGDKSDGMYIVRGGKLKVFQRKEGKEVTLAFLDAGSIIGEMAFFENKPRSAAVKAVEKTEVTVIDNRDFTKLLKQIPGWFVIMMRSLSSRLRTTNDKLTQASKGGTQIQRYPLHDVSRISTIIMLLCQKEAEKLGKEFVMNQKRFQQVIQDVFNDDYDRIKSILDVYKEHGFLKYAVDDYKNEVISFHSRALFFNFVYYLQSYALQNRLASCCLGDEAINLLRTMVHTATSSTYESMSLQLSALKKKSTELEDAPFDTQSWKAAAKELITVEVVIETQAGADDVGFKAVKKDIESALLYHKIIKDFCSLKLA